MSRWSRARPWVYGSLAAGAIAAIAAEPLLAREAGQDFLAGPAETLKGYSLLWAFTIARYAENLFLTLAVLDLTLFLTKAVLRGTDGQTVINALVMRMVIQSFLFNLLVWSPGVSAGPQRVIEWGIEVGADAAGIDHLRPGAFLVRGTHLATIMMAQKYRFVVLPVPQAGLLDAAAVVTIASFALVSVFGYLLVIESIVATHVAFIAGAFAASEMTIGYAANWISWVLQAAMRQMVLHLMYGLGFNHLVEMIFRAAQFDFAEITGYFFLAGGSVLLAAAMILIPIHASRTLAGNIQLERIYSWQS